MKHIVIRAGWEFSSENKLYWKKVNSLILNYSTLSISISKTLYWSPGMFFWKHCCLPASDPALGMGAALSSCPSKPEQLSRPNRQLRVWLLGLELLCVQELRNQILCSRSFPSHKNPSRFIRQKGITSGSGNPQVINCWRLRECIREVLLWVGWSSPSQNTSIWSRLLSWSDPWSVSSKKLMGFNHWFNRCAEKCFG